MDSISVTENQLKHFSRFCPGEKVLSKFEAGLTHFQIKQKITLSLYE